MRDKTNSGLVLVGTMLISIILLCGAYIAYFSFFNRTLDEKSTRKKPVVVNKENSFNLSVIKEINKNEKKNYLVSPYSVEVALSMLRDGCDGNTRKELDKLLSDREINYFNAGKKINVANGMFVNRKYKDAVLNNYYDTVESKYNSEIIYDNFEGPEVVNNWVNEKTNKMIPKLLDKLNKEDLIVLVNALAIDVQWKYEFDCNNTYKTKFTKLDGSKYDVSMMSKTFEEDVKYFKTDNAKGVILPYEAYDEDNSRLEFIGILPDKDVNEYVSSLDENELKNIDKNAKVADEDEKVVLALPKFKYDYEIKNLKDNLKNLGVKDVFEEGADLSKMINVSSHVSQVVHKTHIEVKEKGTKAAAATAVVVTKDTAAMDDPKVYHEVKFDKPFAYIIRDKESKEMLFFGVIYEPNNWEENNCKK